MLKDYVRLEKDKYYNPSKAKLNLQIFIYTEKIQILRIWTNYNVNNSLFT